MFLSQCLLLSAGLRYSRVDDYVLRSMRWIFGSPALVRRLNSKFFWYSNGPG